jgi:hypothetical protein
MVGGFLQYLQPIVAPIKWVRNKFIQARTVEGRYRVDIHRVKEYKNLAAYRAKQAKQEVVGAKDKAVKAKNKVQGKVQSAARASQAPPPGGPAMAGAAAGGGQVAQPGAARYAGVQPGGPGPQGGYGPGPGGGSAGRPGGGQAPVNGAEQAGSPAGPGGIVVAGALWWKKHLCANCGQRLDKSWDRCPYCTPGGGPVASPKTQAIMMDAAGQGSGLQLLGWLVSVRGPQRGELFTLAPHTSIGTDANCTVVLHDQYMSAQHAEIKAEGGSWILRDLKSTNGTYVNDKRVEHHELVDNDFVRLGQSVLKFKSL